MLAPITISIPRIAGMTLPVVARIAGVPQSVLKHWLDRKLIAPIVPQRQPGAWNRFQPADAVRMAVIAKLVSFGLTVKSAREVVERRVDSRIASVIAICGDSSWSTLLGQLCGVTLLLSREPNGEIRCMTPCDFGKCSAWVAIDVFRIARDVAERARAVGKRDAQETGAAVSLCSGQRCGRHTD